MSTASERFGCKSTPDELAYRSDARLPLVVWQMERRSDPAVSENSRELDRQQPSLHGRDGRRRTNRAEAADVPVSEALLPVLERSADERDGDPGPRQTGRAMGLRAARGGCRRVRVERDPLCRAKRRESVSEAARDGDQSARPESCRGPTDGRAWRAALDRRQDARQLAADD